MTKFKPPRGERKADKKKSGLPSRDELLAFIASNPGNAAKRDLARHFNIKGNDKIELKRMLRRLEGRTVMELPDNPAPASEVTRSCNRLCRTLLPGSAASTTNGGCVASAGSFSPVATARQLQRMSKGRRAARGHRDAFRRHR